MSSILGKWPFGSSAATVCEMNRNASAAMKSAETPANLNQIFDDMVMLLAEQSRVAQAPSPVTCPHSRGASTPTRAKSARSGARWLCHTQIPPNKTDQLPHRILVFAIRSWRSPCGERRELYYAPAKISSGAWNVTPVGLEIGVGNGLRNGVEPVSRSHRNSMALSSCMVLWQCSMNIPPQSR